MTIVSQLPVTALALALAAYLFRSIWTSYHVGLITLPIRVNSRNIT
jgi:hypothetical protein